jgi:hypothetical protein
MATVSGSQVPRIIMCNESPRSAARKKLIRVQSFCDGEAGEERVVRAWAHQAERGWLLPIAGHRASPR